MKTTILGTPSLGRLPYSSEPETPHDPVVVVWQLPEKACSFILKCSAKYRPEFVEKHMPLVENMLKHDESYREEYESLKAGRKTWFQTKCEDFNKAIKASEKAVRTLSVQPEYEPVGIVVTPIHIQTSQPHIIRPGTTLYEELMDDGLEPSLQGKALKLYVYPV